MKRRFGQTVSKSDVALTSSNQDICNPRFAELDAQIKAEESTRKERPSGKQPKRYRTGHLLPREVRKEITRCAQQLRQHRKLFMADPKLKDRAIRFLRSLLPPKRRSGRPGLASVSKAIILRAKLRRQYPNEKPQNIWKRIYPEAIPGYASMDKQRQQAERLLLRERIRCRRNHGEKWNPSRV
jgi:hypothetical protein